MASSSGSGQNDDYRPMQRRPRSHLDQGDRFIPYRSATAPYLLTGARKKDEKANRTTFAYQHILREALLGNRTRILGFKPKPPPARVKDLVLAAPDHLSSHRSKPSRRLPQIQERFMVAPDLIDDDHLNLLDWGSSNGVAISLGDDLVIWDAEVDGESVYYSVTVELGDGPVTSVGWAPDGKSLAVGLNCSDVRVWDAFSGQQTQILRRAHSSRVGSLSWNDNHILTTGGRDGLVISHDLKVPSHVTHTYRGHQSDVGGLKWSGSEKQLASGGSDHLIHIWDLAMSHHSSSFVLSQN